MLLDPRTITIPPIWNTPRQREMYRQGYKEAYADECDGFLWAKLRGRSRMAYEAGREAGYALRKGCPAPNPLGSPHIAGAMPVDDTP